MSDESRAAISARLLAAPPEPQRRETAPARGPFSDGDRGHASPSRSRSSSARFVRRGRAREQASRCADAGGPRPHVPRIDPRDRRCALLPRPAPPDEIVRLDDGRIELDVIPLAAGERFRVVTDHGEVEVRGTSFEVLAANRQPAIRSRCRAGASRSLGQRARRPGRRRQMGAGRAAVRLARAWLAAQAPARAARAGSRSHGRTSARPRSRAPCSIARWSSLRAGNAGEAAATFADLERRARGRAIEEDALYWRAVSVARTKDSASAGLLFREFLRRFPASSRRGEAAVALGWILPDAENVNEARHAFEQALADPAASVRDSAAEGIRRTTPPDFFRVKEPSAGTKSQSHEFHPSRFVLHRNRSRSSSPPAAAAATTRPAPVRAGRA